MEKHEVPEAVVTKNGIENDGYSSEWGRKWGRQISCLNLYRIINFNQEYKLNAGPGTFDENILVDGLDLSEMTVGDRLRLGNDVIIEITQIGKERTLNSLKNSRFSLLAFEGVFCQVIRGGKILKGDPVEMLNKVAQVNSCVAGDS